MKLECKIEEIKNKIFQVERITGKNLLLVIRLKLKTKIKKYLYKL